MGRRRGGEGEETLGRLKVRYKIRRLGEGGKEGKNEDLKYEREYKRDRRRLEKAN